MTHIWRDRFLLSAPFVGVGLLLAISPGDDGPTVCPFALCTGTACPGCGLTRATSHLIRGDLGAAFSYHPLVMLIAVQAMFGWVWFVLRRSGRVEAMSQRTLNLILFGTAVIFSAVWIVRLTAGTLPPV